MFVSSIYFLHFSWRTQIVIGKPGHKAVAVGGFKKDVRL